MKLYVLYHDHCNDGFGAAWVVNKARIEGVGEIGRYEDVLFVPVLYGREDIEFQEMEGHDVLILDFSYPYDELIRLAAIANHITLLDHHDTAYKDIMGKMHPSNLHTLMDMERSGSQLAWEYFYGAEARPDFLKMVGERDLWDFSNPDTEAFHEGSLLSPRYFSTWDSYQYPNSLNRLIDQGRILIEYRDQQIEAIIKSTLQTMIIGHATVPVVNCPYVWASQAGHVLAEYQPFAASYVIDSDGMICFSLRADDGSACHVGEIAKLYGGGGHAKAAGFKVTSFLDLNLIEPPPCTGVEHPDDTKLAGL